MEYTSYYYIYSAMTQATGSLLALVGVFIIFRLQLQRERIQVGYAGLRTLLSPKSADKGQPAGSILYKTRKELDRICEEMIRKKEDTRWEAIENEYNSLGKHKKVLKNIRARGVGICSEIALIFIFYILALHLNEKILTEGYGHIVFYIGLVLSFIIVIRILSFLKKCIIPYEDELLI